MLRYVRNRVAVTFCNFFNDFLWKNAKASQMRGCSAFLWFPRRGIQRPPDWLREIETVTGRIKRLGLSVCPVLVNASRLSSGTNLQSGAKAIRILGSKVKATAIHGCHRFVYCKNIPLSQPVQFFKRNILIFLCFLIHCLAYTKGCLKTK